MEARPNPRRASGPHPFAGMNPPSSILVRGVNWLGDAVMTTPALLRLREACPHAAITLLTPAKLAELWPAHPALDAVLTFAPDESPWSVAKRLRAGRFDTALVLPNSPRSALEGFLARIPRRIGIQQPWRNWLLTERVAPRPAARRMHKPSVEQVRARLAGHGPESPISAEAHHSLDYLNLARALGANSTPLPPRLVVSEEEVHSARERFGIEGNTLWLGLNPGAEYGPAKRWPSERFAAAAVAVSSQEDVRWVLFGGPKDQAITGQIARAVPGAVDVAGRTTLRELMALLAACRVVLTNDTGPMHVAAALGVPVVVPFGSTSPELTGPGMPGDRRHHLLQAGVACAPCFLRECPIDFRCMKEIGVDRVVERIRIALRTGAGGTHPVAGGG